jgi:hypothetical protein
VGFESWLERDHVMLLDFDPLVVGLSSQPFWLSWSAGGRRRRHAPDFFARLADRSGVIVDVRPDERIGPEDAEVFAVTAEACESVGWQYRRVGAVDPVLVVNVRWLAAYRHRRCLNLAYANALDEVFAVSRPLADGVAAVGDRLVVLPTLFHLLWTGVLRADLRTSPLGEATIICHGPGVVVTVSRPARLTVGDEVLYRGSTYTITMLSGSAAVLTGVTGTVVTLPFAELFAEASFDVIGRRRRAPLPPRGVLEGLSSDVVDKAQWWERHVVEDLTGAPPNASATDTPRPEYDPLRCTLRQREISKISELAVDGHPVPLSTLQRMRRRYQSQGLLGLVDGRIARCGETTVDERVTAAITKAIAAETDRSTGTVTRLRRRVEQILTGDYGVDPATVMPAGGAGRRRSAHVRVGADPAVACTASRRSVWVGAGAAARRVDAD